MVGTDNNSGGARAAAGAGGAGGGCNSRGSNDVHVAAMGDVSCLISDTSTTTTAHVEIFKSDKSIVDHQRVEQSLRFIVELTDEQRARHNGALMLCWVDRHGYLHHYYEYGDGTMDHDEITYIGDAFVVYHSDSGDNDVKKPVTVDDLLDDSADAIYTVLCSYRLRLPLDSKVYSGHCVKYVGGETMSCTVTPMPKTDCEYRVIADLPINLCRMPPPQESWEVKYEYICPPLPKTEAWNCKKQTIYTWGDVGFDDYGASHYHNVPPHFRAVHPCYMNQIVPQVMIGNCLASNSANYNPSWTVFDAWVIQAQYFWQPSETSCRALCGKNVHVEPGDVIRTRIRYNATDGSMHVSIAVVDEDGWEHGEKRSDIVIPKPFLHDPSLFASWKDFFEKCVEAENQEDGCGENASNKPRREEEEEDVSKPGLRGTNNSKPGLRGTNNKKKRVGIMTRPALNVEYKGWVDIDTLKSVCPFVVKEVLYPGVPAGDMSKWKKYLYSPRAGRGDVLQDATKTKSLTIDDAITMGL